MAGIINTYTRTFPRQPTADEDGLQAMHITAVLTGDSVGQYAVYVGNGTPGWIEANGAKLSYREALAWFPDLQTEKYRR